MSTAIVATPWCPGIEIVDGEAIVCGSTDADVIRTSREDHGKTSYVACATCGTRYVQLTISLPGVAWGDLAHEWRRLDRIRNERYRLKHRGPPANDHPGRPRRADVRIRRVVAELDDPIAPGQTRIEA